MPASCPMAHCPMARCPMTRCPMARCPMARCPMTCCPMRCCLMPSEPVPLDDDHCPHYLEVVDTPMDLGTILGAWDILQYQVPVFWPGIAWS